jgi:hypothetical protein
VKPEKPHDPFKNRHKFQDDVWGQIRLNDLERDVIDAPEFQRLFRTAQLGFVDLVYHTANHTRGAHSIGACRTADRLIDHLVDNTTDCHENYEEVSPGLYASFEISAAERILIRLGALLHDISHVPLSHDLEKKTHVVFYPDSEPLKLRSWYSHYDKHDDYKRNPLLYLLICDRDTSVLARVLRHYSKPFWEQLQRDGADPRHHHVTGLVKLVKDVSPKNDVEWAPERDLLPQLLFHLLFYEKPQEAENAVPEIATGLDGRGTEAWHLGPKSLGKDLAREWHREWYQPFRHDIIGNTLSADLIDYLTRDPQRLGTKRRIDLHLLSYYVLVNPNRNESPKRFRCAIDLYDHKRGTTRTFLLNDLFRLLDLRQDIHEKAVMHRVVQSANAMLARGLLLLGADLRPPLAKVVGLGRSLALQSEDVFFSQLLKTCEDGKADSAEARRHLVEARRIFEKITERRVCRPLMVIPGDWAADKLPLSTQNDESTASGDFPLRTLAAIVDSAYYSPFLLFVCSCVEKHLEGIFDTDTDLCSYAEGVSSTNAPASLVEAARAVIPSRVIIWTAPYKQLYKDPGIVVALDGCVNQIDDLVKPEFRHEIHDKSTRLRIETAIRDADSKYATLWQLYVFISDGLYYSGILNKLLSKLPASCTGGQRRDTHEKRLRSAEAFLTVAFEAVCSNWHGLNTKITKVEDKQKLLDSRMDADAFKRMIGRWVSVYRDVEGRVEKLSIVDIRHYYHEYSLDEDVPAKLKRPCRDSRYKFDKYAEQAWAKAEQTPDSDENKLVRFLKDCQIKNPRLLSDLEFKQLVDLYRDAETRRLCDELVAEARGDQTVIPQALKGLLLSGFPLQQAKLKSLATSEFPVGRSAIRKWVLDESEILHRNVRRQLTEDLDPILDVLEWAAARHERAVFDDFRLRLQNEATLMWNDVRSGRIVGALKRKWNYSEGDQPPDGGGD